MTRRFACWNLAPSFVPNEAQIETQFLSALHLSRSCYKSTDRTRNSLIAVASLLLVNFKLLSIYCKAWFAKPSYLSLLSEVLCKIAVQWKVWAMFQSRIRWTKLLAWNRFLVQKLLFPQLFNKFSALYLPRRFMTMFTKASRNLSLP